MKTRKQLFFLVVGLLAVLVLSGCDVLLTEDEEDNTGTLVDSTNGFVGIGGEVEIELFNLAIGSTYRVVLSGMSSDLDLVVRTAGGSFVGSSSNFGTETDSVTFTATTTVYDAFVRHFSGSSSSFTLSLYLL